MVLLKYILILVLGVLISSTHKDIPPPGMVRLKNKYALMLLQRFDLIHVLVLVLHK